MQVLFLYVGLPFCHLPSYLAGVWPRYLPLGLVSDRKRNGASRSSFCFFPSFFWQLLTFLRNFRALRGFSLVHNQLHQLFIDLLEFLIGCKN